MKLPTKIIITEDQAKERLDIFLSKELAISRSQAQKLIENEQVLLNKKLTTKASERLKTTDIISFTKNKGTQLSTEPETKSSAGSTTKNKELIPQIIADTPDYIVINKPTGMLSHPTMAKETNTVANFVTKKYPKIKKVGDDPIRPGIVHRLDKEASGLMVIAKTTKMFNSLKDQFKNRTIEKEYLALAHGKVARDWGEINFPITRSETSERMAAVPNSSLQNMPDAKEAKTEFLVEKKFVNFTLLRIKIYTGRMHQIRVHLLAYNHPLVGDPLYFQKKQKRNWDEKLGRLFLHSAKLGFTDLDNQKQTFELPLPTDLSDFLKLLK